MNAGRLKLESKLIGLLVTSIALLSVETFAYVSCEDWEEPRSKITQLDTKDAHWNGESITLRYWSEFPMDYADLELTYWTKEGGKYKADSGFKLGGSLSNQWDTFTVDLQYEPTRYMLQHSIEFCAQVREPTLWEKMKSGRL